MFFLVLSYYNFILLYIAHMENSMYKLERSYYGTS